MSTQNPIEVTANLRDPEYGATNYSPRFMYVTTLTSRYHGTPSLIPRILSNIIEFQFFTFQIKSFESKSSILLRPAKPVP